MPIIAALDYPGYCIDCGVLRKLEPWEELTAPAPIRTAAVVPAAARRVYPVAVSGRLPDALNVQRIRQAVDAIPAKLLRKWIGADGRLEIVPGHNASAHPRFAFHPPAAGWNEFHGPFCVVAGDVPDAPLTAAHEIGHAVDFLLGYPSHSAAWLRIWQQEKSAGRVPSFAGQREQPSEYWTEQFARRWDSELYPSRAAQDFIERLQT